MKKQLPTHDDTPSVKPQPKVVKTQTPNYEGDVKQSKHNDGEKGTPLPPKTIETVEPSYEGEVSKTRNAWENYEEKPHTSSLPTSKSGDPYPLPHEDIDIYSVDTRIWDRMGQMGGGDGGGPHTHDGLYAPVTHDHDYLTDLPTHDHPHGHDDLSPKSHLHPENAPLVHTHDYTSKDYVDDQDRAWDVVAKAYTDDQIAEHLANAPHGGGSGGDYDDTALTARVSKNETDIAGLDASLTSAEQNIQANTEALAGKADDPHEHPLQPHAHDYNGNVIDGGDFTPHNHNGVYQPVGDYALADHTHEQEQVVSAYRFEGVGIPPWTPEEGQAQLAGGGGSNDYYVIKLSKTDADGKTFTPPEVGPCDIDVKFGDDTIKLVEVTGVVGDHTHISIDAWVETPGSLTSLEGVVVYWDLEKASVPPHTHPELEGGGSGLFYPYDKAVLFGGSSTYYNDTNFFDKTLFPNGTLKRFYRVGQTSSTNTSIFVQSEWSYQEKGSSFKVANIHADGAVVAETGIVAPMVSYGIYGKTINFHPSSFVEATEAGKAKLLEVILSSINGSRGYACGAPQADGTALTAKSITTPTIIYDGIKHKNYPVWLAIDQTKNIWVVGDKDALVEGQDLTGLRMMTAEEFASFQLEEQGE